MSSNRVAEEKKDRSEREALMAREFMGPELQRDYSWEAIIERSIIKDMSAYKSMNGYEVLVVHYKGADPDNVKKQADQDIQYHQYKDLVIWQHKTVVSGAYYIIESGEGSMSAEGALLNLKQRAQDGLYGIFGKFVSRGRSRRSDVQRVFSQ